MSMRFRFGQWALAAVLFAAGCSNSHIIDDPQGVQRVDDEPVKTIVVWHTYSDQETKIFEETLIPRFERNHPGVRIESVRQEYNLEYRAAIAAKASAGATPDVVRMEYSWVPDFASKRLLYPLDAFPDFAEAAGALAERMKESGYYQGRAYALPLNMNTKAAVYNAELARRAGVNPAEASLPEVLEAARGHGLVVGMAGLEMWQSLPYFFGLGGRLADKEFQAASGYFDSDESVRAMETLLEWHRAGVLAPELLDDADLWGGIRSGERLLMMDEGPWFYSILLNSAEVGRSLMSATTPAPFPQGPEYGAVVGGESLVITKGSRHKEEAWAFIRWMLGKEAQTALFGAGLIPTHREALRDAEQIVAENPYLKAYMEGIADSFVRPPVPQWSKVEEIYKKAMEDMFLHNRDVRVTLNEAAARMDEALNAGGRSSDR
ncbi:extracellular solute-binding protein [Paenibacillus sp.]|uniref:extracellular solute-binding protein n=1 Tax=Paenibacillus sp. TaxID=58172 RepID=UPI002D570E68|nr:extracellular solute-binding protein [Paenibacillus sp.]HZG86303.1 extracellular solute-binding protein [Paenibacillus sp.]